MNDLRPVALTSVAFKTCERIVLPQLKSFIHDSLDPFQIAYQNNRSCEDALLVTGENSNQNQRFLPTQISTRLGNITQVTIPRKL